MKRNRFAGTDFALPVMRLFAIFFTSLLYALTLAACGSVKSAPQAQSQYRPMSLPGQVSQERLQALKKEYPEGYYRKHNQNAIAEEDKIRIGIVAFAGSGNGAALASQVTDYFITAFVQSGDFKIYERKQLEKLVAEVELGQTGLLNDDTVEQVGRMAGIQLMVTGNISDVQGRNRIDVKAIDVGSGRLVLAEKMEGILDSESVSFLAGRVMDKLKALYYKQ